MPEKRPTMRQIAAERLLNGGLEVAERLEEAAMDGIRAGDWAAVRRSLKLRLAMRLKPEPPKAVQIDRILRLLDEAEARGVSGPVTAPGSAQESS